MRPSRGGRLPLELARGVMGEESHSQRMFMTRRSRLAGCVSGGWEGFGVVRRLLGVGCCGVAFAGALISMAQVSTARDEGPSKPREIRLGVVGVGLVEVDAVRKVMSFPARVNMVEGNLEYTLVNPNGPVHEALLVTETRAEDIELGARLLGLSKEKRGRADGSGAGNLTKDALLRAPKPEGVDISVDVLWKGDDGSEKRRGLLDLLVRKGPEGKPFSREGAWVYTGSKVIGNGVFLASGSGILGSMLLASEPLFVGTFEGNRDDSVWSPAKELLPKVGTVVRVEMISKPAQ
jgi:hypothetical protein